LLSTYPQAATAAAAVAGWTTARYRNSLRRLREYCVTQYRDTTVEMGGAEKTATSTMRFGIAVLRALKSQRKPA